MIFLSFSFVKSQTERTKKNQRHKHSTLEKRKTVFLSSRRLCFDSGVVISFFLLFRTQKCVRRRVVLLGAKLKHFALQMAIDYNTITARTTSSITRSNALASTYQFEQQDINSMKRRRIMFLKSTINGMPFFFPLSLFLLRRSLFSFDNSLLVDRCWIFMSLLWL